MKIETKEFKALALLHQALVDIALGDEIASVPRVYPLKIARRALRQLALDHPEVVEALLCHETFERAKRRQVV